MATTTNERFGSKTPVSAYLQIHGKSATFAGQPLSPARLIWLIWSNTQVLLLEPFRAGVPFRDRRGGLSVFDNYGNLVEYAWNLIGTPKLLSVAINPTPAQLLTAYAASEGFTVKAAPKKGRKGKVALPAINPAFVDFLISMGLTTALAFIDVGLSPAALAKLKPHMPKIVRIHEVSGQIIHALDSKTRAKASKR